MTHNSDFESLIPHMKRAGFTATALAAVITSMFGFQLGENIVAKFAMAGLLALATFIVGYSLVAAYEAHKRGMKGVAAAAVALFAIGVTVEFMSHTGFTAANRDASIQQANFQSTTYADSRGNVKDLEAKVARMSDERSLMKPVNSPAKAKAVIQFSEAHKFWNSTDNCKATKGPQTRAFCDAYLSAQADLSLWDSIAKQETKIAEGEVALRDARAESGTKQAGHAAGASQSMILASLATGQENPDQAAQFWSGVGVSALLALFAIAAGGLLNFIAFAFDAPRKAVEAAKSAAANMVASINDRPQSRPLTLLDQFRSEGRLAA